MSRELVPELHDALKLTKYEHVLYEPPRKFEKEFPLDKFGGLVSTIKTKTWQGVIGHHLQKGVLRLPDQPDTFMLNLADGLAANFSRVTRPEKGKVEEDIVEEGDNHVLHKLWHHREEGDRRLDSDNQIRALLEFLIGDPSAEDFFQSYDSILRTRPEDSHKGMNVTSLLTHLKLTGQFYRILCKSFRGNAEEALKDTLMKGEEEKFKEISSLRRKKSESEWKLSIASCRFRFHQRPIRARDLNIFLQLDELAKKVKGDFRDNVLFSTSEELIIIYGDKGDLENICKIAIEKGFWIETEAAERPIREIKPNVSELSGKKDKNFYGYLDEQIEPPICEICQMREGSKEWKEGEGPIEYLCPTCYDVRGKRAPLAKLRYWIDEEGEVFSLLWVKIKLDYSLLNQVLNTLYADYLKGLRLSTDEATTRFSIISEFQEDYDGFLRDLRERINREFGEEHVQRVLEDFYCIKAEKTGDILKLLKIYKELLEGYFSKFLTLSIDSPLTLSIVLSPSKFPFFQCWREIEDSKPDIHIALIGHGETTVRNKNLNSLLQASDVKYRKTALHKLAEVSRLSEALAKLRFEDKSRDEDSQTYRQLRERLLPLGMKFRDILTFARILED